MPAKSAQRLTCTRIDRAFSRLREEGRKGFVAYITAGDPSLDDTEDMVLRLERAGADVVELGIPFSDPLADGRVNQMSAMRALEQGATFDGVVKCISRIRRRSEVPLLCYSYMNPMLARGFDRSVKLLAEAGLDGLLVLDLPVEEEDPYTKALALHGMNNIRLVTPTSPDARIRQIVAKGSGFIYCVSREGVTGMQKQLSGSARDVVERTRRHTRLPIALGFGISTPEQARAAAAAADAVVVGSAIVSRFHESPHTPQGRAQAAAWVSKLVRAVKEA